MTEENARDVQVVTTVDGTLMTTARADESRCDALAPNSLIRCSYRTDHPPLIVGGARYDHHVPGVVSWDLPTIEPPAPRCESTPGVFDWPHANPRCTLAAGHEGAHRNGITTWGLGPSFAAEVAFLRELASAGGPFARGILSDARPVRVRFIELPYRTEQREVFSGIDATVSVSGGFALVVDRFNHRQHRDDEQEYWQDLGALIGARLVLCYPGTLDIEPWMDAAA